MLWSASASGDGPLRYDPATATATGACLPADRGNGFGVDPVTGEVWHTS